MQFYTHINHNYRIDDMIERHPLSIAAKRLTNATCTTPKRRGTSDRSCHHTGWFESHEAVSMRAVAACIMYKNIS